MTPSRKKSMPWGPLPTSCRASSFPTAISKFWWKAWSGPERVDDRAGPSHTIAANLQLPVDEKQDLLETVDPVERLNRIGDILEIELEKLNVDRNINTRVKRQMERAQKEYYLNEKLKAIQKELGRGEKSETDELKKKLDSAGMPKEVHEKATAELKRLELMPPMSAEST